MRWIPSLFLLLSAIIVSAQGGTHTDWLPTDVKGQVQSYPQLSGLKFSSSATTLLSTGEIALAGLDNGQLSTVVLNLSGQVQHKFQWITPGLRKINALTASGEGGFLLGGQYNSNGSSYAGLLWLDQEGRVLDQLVIGEAHRTASITAIIDLPDNSYLAVREEGSRSWLYHFSTKRDSLEGKAALVQLTAPIALGTFRCKASAKGPLGEIALVGQKGAVDLLAMRTVQYVKGEIKFKSGPTFSSKYKSGKSVVFDYHKQHYVIAGSFPESKDDYTDVYTISVDLVRTVKELIPPFGRERRSESVDQLVLLPNRQMLYCGRYPRVGYDNFWLGVTNLDQNTSIPTIRHYQVDDELVFPHAWYTPDRTVYLLGFWGGDKEIVNLTVDQIPNFTPPITTYAIDSLTWQDEVQNDTLHATERSRLKLYWTASTDEMTFGKVKVSLQGPGSIFAEREHFLPLSKGTRQGVLDMGLIGLPDLPTSELLVKVTLQPMNGGAPSTREYLIQTKKGPSPILQFTGPPLLWMGGSTWQEGDTLKRLDTLRAAVVLQNTGKRTAQHVEVFLKLPYHVHAFTPILLTTDSLPPNALDTFYFDVTPYSYYSHEHLPLYFFAREYTAGSTDFTPASVPLRNVFAIEKPDGSIYTPKRRRGNKGGPYEFDFYPEQRATEIKLISPKEGSALHGIEVNSYSSPFPSRVEISSTIRLKKSDITITHKRPGSKKHTEVFGKNQNQTCYHALILVDSLNGRYRYEFQAELMLFPSNGSPNIFRINVHQASKEFRIMHKEVYKRLWLHTIGVPDTLEDIPTPLMADSIGHFYEMIRGNKQTRYFDTINIKYHNTLPTTSGDQLEEIFKSLSKQPEFGYKRNNNTVHDTLDIVMVYLASHGSHDNNGLKIFSSEKHIHSGETIKLDFDGDIIQWLGHLPEMKYIFLETCFSNTATSIAEAYESEKRLGENFYGINLIGSASTQAYFDDKNPFPILTSALLELFNTLHEENGRPASVLPEDWPDSDYNGVVSFCEIIDFVTVFSNRFTEENKDSHPWTKPKPYCSKLTDPDHGENIFLFEIQPIDLQKCKSN